ncbi:DUF2242 domain-containing protein [Rubrivivax sp. JA1024]|nr:DUF2242 domain-containing protein [Rubrivivax sp. JA1024]
MTQFLPLPARHRAGAFTLLALAAVVAGCSTPNKIATTVYQNEHFRPDETYSRQFEADAPTTCEAARLALLSQGYVVTSATPELVVGNKRFQPDGEIHVQITFTVTCAPDPFYKASTTAFVNAVQDRYTLKKASSSASVGLPVGSLSIPLSASDDSLVKVGSLTIPAGSFYDRFFGLVQRYVRSRVCGGEERCAAIEAAEVEAARAAAASASAAP